jgi:hypothetical protein
VSQIPELDDETGKAPIFFGERTHGGFFLNPLISMGSLAPESGFNQRGFGFDQDAFFSGSEKVC